MYFVFNGCSKYTGEAKIELKIKTGVCLKHPEYTDAIKGDLDSVKEIMDRRKSVMEENVAGRKSFHAEIGEQQKSLKQELREELLQKLTTPTSLGVT